MKNQPSLYSPQPVKCYSTHPEFKVGGLSFFGGSCITPEIKDADVYIGFDRNMTHRPYKLWKGETAPLDAYFYIQDMSIPTNAEDFKDLCEWAIEQAKAGKKVHAGCIGGHGRTGMFLAAVAQLVDPSVNAIDYVREHYCHHAVETTQQEKFLQQAFGCQTPTSSSKYGNSSSLWKDENKVKSSSKTYNMADNLSITPVRADFCLFDKTL